MQTMHLLPSVAIQPNRVENSAQTTSRFSPVSYLAPRTNSFCLTDTSRKNTSFYNIWHPVCDGLDGVVGQLELRQAGERFYGAGQVISEAAGIEYGGSLDLEST